MLSNVNVLLPHVKLTLLNRTGSILLRVQNLVSSLHAVSLTTVWGAPYTALLGDDTAALRMPTKNGDRVEIGIKFLPPKGQLLHKNLWESYLGYQVVLTPGTISLYVSGIGSREWNLSDLESELDIIQYVPHRMIVQLDSPLSFTKLAIPQVVRVRNSYSMHPFNLLASGSNVTVLNIPRGTDMNPGEYIAGPVSSGPEGELILYYAQP